MAAPYSTKGAGAQSRGEPYAALCLQFTAAVITRIQPETLMHRSRLGISLAVIVVVGAGLYLRPHVLRASDSDSAGIHASNQQRDSVVTVTRLRFAVDSFVRTWRYAWEVSDRYRDLAVVTGA